MVSKCKASAHVIILKNRSIDFCEIFVTLLLSHPGYGTRCHFVVRLLFCRLWGTPPYSLLLGSIWPGEIVPVSLRAIKTNTNLLRLYNCYCLFIKKKITFFQITRQKRMCIKLWISLMVFILIWSKLKSYFDNQE